MEVAEEEHEQAVVTSSSSPSSVIDILDSKFLIERENRPIQRFICLLEYLEKAEDERILTPELEQILSQIAKTGYSR